MKELEVEHPAASILSLASQMQDQEFGDATNLTVTFAGNLLKLAAELLGEGLHTSEIVSGYKTAADYTLAALPKLVCQTVEVSEPKKTLVCFIFAKEKKRGGGVWIESKGARAKKNKSCVAVFEGKVVCEEPALP